MVSRRSVKLAGTAGLAALLASSAPAFASECKGLEQPRCESNESCSWVDSYQRKDGIKVAGHCRVKSGKKKAVPSSS